MNEVIRNKVNIKFKGEIELEEDGTPGQDHSRAIRLLTEMADRYMPGVVSKPDGTVGIRSIGLSEEDLFLAIENKLRGYGREDLTL